MGDLFQPWHLIILAGLAILLFGGKKLPELGKGLGEGLRGFKEGMKGVNDDLKADVKPSDSAHAVTPKPAHLLLAVMPPGLPDPGAHPIAASPARRGTPAQ